MSPRTSTNSTDPESKETTIAVVGAGYWGKNLVRNFFRLPKTRLKYVCDASPEALVRHKHDYPNAEMVEDIAVVLRDESVDAVAVAVPAVWHFEVAKKVLEAGKHLFVEKPMTLTVAHSEELVRLARDKGVVLMVGHLMVYHPAVSYLDTMIQDGELGDVRYAYSQRVNLGKVRTDENAMWSLGVHDISMMNHLFGSQPHEVVGQGSSFVQKGVADVAFGTMKYSENRLAHIHVSWLDPHKERKLTIVGSERMAVFDDRHLTEKIRIYNKGVQHDWDSLTQKGYGEVIAVRDGDILIPYLPAREPLNLECQHFVDCVVSGDRPKSSGEDGLGVVKTLAALQYSMDHGGVPVTLDGLVEEDAGRAGGADE